MSTFSFRPTRDQFAYTFGGVAPLHTVRPGDVLQLWSEDAFNGAVRSVGDKSAAVIDFRFGNPQTGPFYLAGAEPGDTIVLHIVDLTPARDWGASATIPFFGGMTGNDRTPTMQPALPDTTWIYQVDRAAGTVGFRSRFPRTTGGDADLEIALPLDPMLGTVGVAPAGGEVRSALVPERFGGVNVEGALFSIGDGHYRQGEGESCGNAVEGAMDSTILVDLIKGGAPGWPRLENDDYWMVVGSARPMEDAWRVAHREMVTWISELLGIHEMDAYQLLTQITRAPIANVVDPNFSVVIKVPKSPFPSASAFGAIHRQLRAQAVALR